MIRFNSGVCINIISGSNIGLGSGSGDIVTEDI